MTRFKHIKEMTYEQRLQQTKEYLLNDMLPKYAVNEATFIQIENKLKEKGFYEPIEKDIPERCWNIGLDHNIIFWQTDNKLLFDAITELRNSKTDFCRTYISDTVHTTVLDYRKYKIPYCAYKLVDLDWIKDSEDLEQAQKDKTKT
jgi:hypothetical protein